jgi:hypothetical protein
MLVKKEPALFYAAIALAVIVAYVGISFVMRRNAEKNAPAAKKQTHSDHVFKM